MVLNIEHVNMLQKEERPEIVLIVKGTEVKFLCDSGAARSLIHPSEAPGVLKTNSCVYVRSASGLIHKEGLSALTWLEDPETGKSVRCQFVLSNGCPCNLLGRDMMQALNIAVVPTQRGVKVLRIYDNNVIEGEDVPHYWYSLDLVNSGPGSVTSSLVKTVRKRVPPGSMIMNSDELHCTLFYKMSKGSEPSYEEQLSK